LRSILDLRAIVEKLSECRCILQELLSAPEKKAYIAPDVSTDLRTSS
ncbi:7694_t:CDS:2, partial [Dentiscutata erythropus]